MNWDVSSLQYPFYESSCQANTECRTEFMSILQNAEIPHSVYMDALSEILANLCWKGTPKELISTLPLGRALTFEDVRDVLAQLGYDSEIVPPKDLDMIRWPTLHVPVNGSPHVLLPTDTIPRSGILLVVSPQVEPLSKPPNTSWLSWTVSSLWGQLSGAFVASFFINAVGLALPFFTRYVYDRAIPARSVNALIYLGIGVGLAILFGTLFRIIRSRLLTYSGGRTAFLSSVESMKRILSLPLAVLTRSSTDSHILRLRDLERVREFVSGAFATAIMDAPFILLFLGAIAYLGGWLVLVPIAFIFLYAIIVPFLTIFEDRAMRRAARLNAQRTAIQQDSVEHLKDFVGVGLEECWSMHYARISVQAAAANRKYSLAASTLRVVAKALSTLTALATLGFGMILVLQNLLTPGGLIASMMLIWRTTAPIQAFATSFSRYYQLRHSARQIDRLMNLQGENLESSLVSPLQDISPSIKLNKTVFRYTADREPALAGVSFDVNEGEVVGITGPNGAGKTTLLLTVAGLLQPQGGSVLIGNRDIRQFMPEDFRSWLGLVPESDQLFTGTLRQNLRVARIEATDDELREALKEAGAGDLEASLPDGLDTEMYTERGPRVGFSMQQALSLSRALVKHPKILLFDEPTFRRSERFFDAFKAIVENTNEKRTILIASHDREILAMCDRVVLMDEGAPVSIGKVTLPETVTVNTSNA